MRYGTCIIADLRYYDTCCVFLADWVDVKDPNVIAETELLQAAASIEAAAKKLAELKPKRTVVCDSVHVAMRCMVYMYM